MDDPQRILRFSNQNGGDARLRLAAFKAGYRPVRLEPPRPGGRWPLVVWCHRAGEGDFGPVLRLVDCRPMPEPSQQLTRAIQSALFSGECPLCHARQHLIDDAGIERHGGMDRVTVWPWGLGGLMLCLPHAEGCLATPRSLCETAGALAN